MASRQDEERVMRAPELFDALSHKIRRDIIKLLYERTELSYTELLTNLGIDPGLLNYHLRHIRGLYMVTEDSTYILTPLGRKAYTLIRAAEELAGPEPPRAEPPRLNLSMVGRRALAFLLDLAVIVVFTAVFMDEHFIHFGGQILSLQVALEDVLGILYDIYHRHPHIFFIAYAWFTLLEAYTGQTLGKSLLGIRVVKMNGRRVTLTDSAIRNLGKVFLLPLDVAAGLVLYSRRGYLRLFDHYVGTTVQRVERSL